ncbi:hypothetical protein Vafri_4279, partial [Volvox africanus]
APKPTSVAAATTATGRAAVAARPAAGTADGSGVIGLGTAAVLPVEISTAAMSRMTAAAIGLIACKPGLDGGDGINCLSYATGLIVAAIEAVASACVLTVDSGRAVASVSIALATPARSARGIAAGPV